MYKKYRKVRLAHFGIEDLLSWDETRQSGIMGDKNLCFFFFSKAEYLLNKIILTYENDDDGGVNANPYFTLYENKSLQRKKEKDTFS